MKKYLIPIFWVGLAVLIVWRDGWLELANMIYVFAFLGITVWVLYMVWQWLRGWWSRLREGG